MNHCLMTSLEELRKALVERDAFKAEVERLKVEVRLLKESTKRLPELLWKTERYTEICDLLIRPRGEDVVGMVESIKKEWDELCAHT